MADVKKYSYMENVLVKINQKFISLDEKDKKLNNVILLKLLDEVISRMKRQNALFEKMYQKIFFGGSYYDGMKIGNPEEYDLDIILDLPKNLEIQLESKKPGYVYVCAKEYEKFMKSEEASKYPKIENLICEKKYFSTNKVRSWIEGLLTKVLKEFDQDEINVHINNKPLKIKIDTFCKSGPAFTLKVKTFVDTKEIKMDIDLVTCFNMSSDKWPKGYVKNPVPSKDTFFVVPKRPPSSVTNGNSDEEKFWRLSFQEQERLLLKGKDYRAMKPCVKLIKQLRDHQNHKVIASYFIKTIFLWELKNQKQDLWANTLSFVFITMLKKYAEYLKKGEILYYWNPAFNLVGHISKVTLTDFGNTIGNILNDIHQHPLDPFIIANYLLPQCSVEELKKEVEIGKKHLKKQQIGVTIQKITKSKPQQSLKFDATNEEHISAVLRDPLFLKSVIEVYQTKLAHNTVKTSTFEHETPGFCVTNCANLINLDSDDENVTSSSDYPTASTPNKDGEGESKFSFDSHIQNTKLTQEVENNNEFIESLSNYFTSSFCIQTQHDNSKQETEKNVKDCLLTDCQSQTSNSKEKVEKINEDSAIDNSFDESSDNCGHPLNFQKNFDDLKHKVEKIDRNVENLTQMLHGFLNSQSKYMNKNNISNIESKYQPFSIKNLENNVDFLSIPSGSQVKSESAQKSSLDLKEIIDFVDPKSFLEF